MATDKITVNLELQARQATREIDRINRKIAEIGRNFNRAFGGGGAGGGDRVRALGTGLSKATVRADEFSKSLEASNARVVAFGASAGIIMQIDRAMKALVTSTMKVEKAMMDVNVVMQTSNKELEKFGKGMFKVARETAQSFDTVAESAIELARQGLGTEKTLMRAKDALILTRLTGMNAADAVKSLTAAVNSFNKEGVTSTQVINRMAKVDAKFAVSSEDLAKSISRVGASAISAGVSMNELMAITTAVQQKTARGGAVIGNAFKTIFTRIQRSDVREQLRDLGVVVTKTNGQLMSGMQVLQQLADNYDNLSKAQQANITEQVAGVFQVNILKAALSDLSSATSNYRGALRAANSATDEAYQKNEKLNQTLDALTNQTLSNLTRAGSKLGEATLAPAINKVLNAVNSIIDSFDEGGRFESFGKGIGANLLKGIGDAIAGPGLVIIGAAIAKLTLSLGKFTTKAFADVMGINKAVQQRIALEEAVIAHISAEPALLARVQTGAAGILAVEQSILATIRAQSLERGRMAAAAAPIGAALFARGARVGPSGVTMRGRPGGAAGFIPNFADAGAERAAAAAGGYRAGAIKTISQPGAGTMMYNSAETVKRFPGMSQSAIMPPKMSPAGANYGAAFNAAHGFNPYAATGFIPNFKKGGGKGEMALRPTEINAAIPIGVLLGEGPVPATGKKYEQNLFGAKGIKKLANQTSGKVPRIRKAYEANIIQNPKLFMDDISSRGVFPLKSAGVRKAGEAASFDDEFNKLEKGLGNFAGAIQGEIFGKGTKRGSQSVRNVLDFMGSSAAGEIFEASVRAALDQNPEMLEGAAKQAPFDFNPKSPVDKDLLRLFEYNNAIERIEAKIKGEAATNILSKYANEFYTPAGDKGSLDAAIGKIYANTINAEKKVAAMRGGRRATGFIPNFSPLTDAVGRELAAGVPASAIRIGSNPSLRSAGNKGGLGVFNTQDEPGGLGQGISRARAQGMNPKTHGYSGGFVPNFNPTTFSQGGFTYSYGAPQGQAALMEALEESQRPVTQSQSKLTKATQALTDVTKKTWSKMKAAGSGANFQGRAMGAAMFAPMLAPMMADMMPGGQQGIAGRVLQEGVGPGVMYGSMAALGLSAGGAAATSAAAGMSAGAGATALGALGGAASAAALPVALVLGAGFAIYKLYEVLNEEDEAAKDAADALKDQTAAQYGLAEASKEAAKNILGLKEGMSGADVVEAREKAIKSLTDSEDFKKLGLGAMPEFSRLKGANSIKEMVEALTQLTARGSTVKRVQAFMEGGGVGTVNRLFAERKKDTTLGTGDFVYRPEGRSMFSRVPYTPKQNAEAARMDAKRLDYIRRRDAGLLPMPDLSGESMGGFMDALGVDVDKFYRDMARGGSDRSNQVMMNLMSQGAGQGGLERLLSIITGDKAEDLAPIGDKLRDNLDTEEMEAFKAALADLFTNAERLKKAQEENAAADKVLLDQIKQRIKVNTALIDRVDKVTTNFNNLNRSAQTDFKLAQLNSKQQLALLKISQDSQRADQSLLKTKRELIIEEENLAKTTNEKVRKEAEGLAKEVRVRDSMKLLAEAGNKAADSLLGLFEEGKLDTTKGGPTRVEAFEKISKDLKTLIDEFKDANIKDAEKVIDRLKPELVGLRAKQAEGKTSLTREEGARLALLKEIIPEFEKMVFAQKNTTKIAVETEADANEAAEKIKDLSIKRYENEAAINEKQKDVAKGLTAILAVLNENYVGRGFDEGTMSGAERSKARLRAREALMRNPLTQEELEAEFGLRGLATSGMDLSRKGRVASYRGELLRQQQEFMTGGERNEIDEATSFGAALADARTELVGFEEALQADKVKTLTEQFWKKGLIGSDAVRERRAADRLARRRRGEGTTEDMGAAFSDQFLYNAQDYGDDFEAGMVQTAQTIQSSFAEAFKNIASGSMKAGEAIATMATGILGHNI